MNQKNYNTNLQVGDIVTCNARKAEYLYKVIEITTDTWTQNDVHWGYCDISDVGKPYTRYVKLKAIMELTLKPTRKLRKISLTTRYSTCDKLEPQKVQDFIQSLKQFLMDNWP